MRSFTSLLFVFAAGISSIVACSSSSDDATSGCASTPFTCAARQTCAPKSASGEFACLASGSGAKGSACTSTVGTTTCSDNLVCLQTTAAGGQCLPFCEPNNAARGCAAGEQCRAAALQGTSSVFYVCVGGTKPADGGASDAATD